MDSEQEKNKREIIKEYGISIIFCLNLVGAGILFFLFEIEGTFDTIIKGISGVLGGISGVMSLFFKSLVKSLNSGEKLKNVSFHRILMQSPLKILNIILFIGLLLIFYHKYFHEVRVELYIKNEFDQIPKGEALIEQSATLTRDLIFLPLEPDMVISEERYKVIKNTIIVSLKPGKYSLTFTGDGYYEIQDTIYVPLFRYTKIPEYYTCHYKKGKLSFKILPEDVNNPLLEIRSMDTPIRLSEPISVRVIGNEFTTDSLRFGKYRYTVSHQWYEKQSGTKNVTKADIDTVPIQMKPESSGIRIVLDSESDQKNIGVFLNRQYKGKYTPGNVLEIKDFDTHLVELKDLEDYTFYYSSYVSLSPKDLEKTLECHLTPQPISYVEFYSNSSGYAGQGIFVDGQYRGSLDSYEGSIFLPVFDGYRDVKIEDWKRTIKFPVIGNYVEIKKAEE